jgi:beta-lactamase regulating signal transducer with metallopeptidase domain
MSTFFDESTFSAALWIAVKATALLGVAAFAQLVMRTRWSAATRHLVWTLALVSVLLLPVMTAVLPDWAVPIRSASASRSAAPHVTPAPEAPDGVESTASLSIALRPIAAAPRRSDFSWPAVIAGVYAAGVIALGMLFGAQLWKARRFTRHTTLVEDPRWTRLLDECASRTGVHRPVRLLRSRAHNVPVALGTRRPSIVLPAVADTWADDRRRAVILHELAHVARRDCLTQALAVAACAIYWFHPAAWWVARRMRIERELACDDRVIAAGTEPRAYAGHLLEIAYSFGGHRAPALAVSMARRHQIEGRLLAALDTGRNRTVPALRVRLAASMLAAALLLPLAIVTPTTAAAERKVEVATDVRLDSHAAAMGVAQGVGAGTWEIRPTSTEGTVHLKLVELNSSTGSNVRIDRLEGLTAAQLAGAGGPVQFRIRRDAGTFTFEGVIRNGVGAGTFSFTPDSNFAGELARRGFARPTASEQYELARHDVGYEFVDELNKQGYAKPQTRELVRAGQHGVRLDYLRDMGALGYRLGSLAPLITLRDHGVTPAYVRELAEHGYKGLPADELRRARDHGVSSEYVRGMREADYRSLTMDELINARDHGVGPDFVRGLAEAGHTKLPLDQLIRVRDHGVTPEYVREMRQLGHTLPINELVRARDHGVSVEYVREMAALGYKSTSMDALIRLRDHGVTAQFAKDLKALGYDQVGLDDLVALRDHGLTAERIRSANARAGSRLPIDLLISGIR